MSWTKTYSELRHLETFTERYHYLKLTGSVGVRTFGADRWINQHFYKSYEWKRIRDYVILRDEGCDLGVEGFEIQSGLLVHHMNPLSVEDIKRGDESAIDSNFLITVSHNTHNAIHFGNESLLPRGPVVRTAGDTSLW